jgi:hypothetical protein
LFRRHLPCAIRPDGIVGELLVNPLCRHLDDGVLHDWMLTSSLHVLQLLVELLAEVLILGNRLNPPKSGLHATRSCHPDEGEVPGLVTRPLNATAECVVLGIHQTLRLGIRERAPEMVSMFA